MRTREEILDYIQNRMSGLGQSDWYTPLCFVEEMKSLVNYERKKSEEAHEDIS